MAEAFPPEPATPIITFEIVNSGRGQFCSEENFKLSTTKKLRAALYLGSPEIRLSSLSAVFPSPKTNKKRRIFSRSRQRTKFERPSRFTQHNREY